MGIGDTDNSKLDMTSNQQEIDVGARKSLLDLKQGAQKARMCWTNMTKDIVLQREKSREQWFLKRISLPVAYPLSNMYLDLINIIIISRIISA